MILSSKIKESILAEGFFDCGFAIARPLLEEAEQFKQSIARGFHADQIYLANEIDDRFNPESLLPNCQTVVAALFPYSTELQFVEVGEGQKVKLSRFKNIGNYHNKVKKRLLRVAENLQQSYACSCRVTVDTSRISEKRWGVQAGLGHIGKNSLLISSQGSFFVMGLLLIDQKVDVYSEVSDRSCGTCTKCMEVCPAKALASPYFVDSRKCYAYLNIRKGVTSKDWLQSGWAKGCDICQEVCPFNAKKQ